jgi:hypothetical protein
MTWHPYQLNSVMAYLLAQYTSSLQYFMAKKWIANCTYVRGIAKVAAEERMTCWEFILKGKYLVICGGVDNALQEQKC